MQSGRGATWRRSRRRAILAAGAKNRRLPSGRERLRWRRRLGGGGDASSLRAAVQSPFGGSARAGAGSRGGPTGPGVRDPDLARVEAVLFMSSAPLSSRKIAEAANLADGTQARTLVRRLNQLYDDEQCAFRVEELAGGFQLFTRPVFGPWLRRLQTVGSEPRLSQPAMETLVIIAYRQPVLRAELEAIRGVQCGEMLKQLLDRDLIKIVGRSTELGRPFQYGTTKKFLQLYGLRSLDDLPPIENFRGWQAELPPMDDSPPADSEVAPSDVAADADSSDGRRAASIATIPTPNNAEASEDGDH